MQETPLYDFTKRVIDLIGVVVLSILFLPICIVAAILIKLDSKGPLFADTPERVGKNGSKFRMYKFRSMIENAHEILRNNPEFKQLYQQYKNDSYKLRNDPRVTRIGRFIRKHSIEERSIISIPSLTMN